MIAWGDSLTSGGDWLAFIEELGSVDWTSEDHGVAGEESWNAAEGTHPQSNRRLRNYLDAYTPGSNDVFVMMWGTNDVRKVDWAAATGTSAATRASLEQMVDDVLALGVPVVLATPPPFAIGTHDQTEVDAFNANLNEVLRPMIEEIVTERRKAGARVVSVSVYDHWLALPGWVDIEYYRLKNGRADGVHPGTQPGASGFPGRYHVAEALVPAISEARRLPVLPLPVSVVITTGAIIALAARSATRGS